MKKIFYTAAVAAIALGMTACGGKKEETKAEPIEEATSSPEESTDESSYESSDDSSNEEESTTMANGEFTCTPATTTVEGPLSDYVTVKDKTYTLEKSSGLGEEYYVLTFDFDVKSAHTFTGTIDITATFYDENGNLIEFPSEYGSYSEASSFSAGFLQMALKNGKDCNRTSVLIRPEHIKDFTPDMLKQIKTFKVQSKLDDYEFSYDPDIWD